MARPEVVKRICEEPQYSSFAPQKGKKKREVIVLSVDEYETIRWIDLEGVSREECAKRMGIARTTAQAIYNSARNKIAKVIVEGAELRIEGGNVVICDGSAGCPQCRRKHGYDIKSAELAVRKKESTEMRIAVTYENGQVFQHFGHTEQFKVYDIENNKIVNTQVVDTNGQGHGALAGFLNSADIDVLICGGIGGGAQTALAAAGIQLFGGVSGDADEAVKSYIEGNLAYNPDVHCTHHDHEEGHSCGEHHCGEDKHGCAGNH